MQNIGRKVIVMALLFSASGLQGGTREHFLSRGPSVAAYGRGDTGVAVFDDNSSTFYNPALLAKAYGSGASLAGHPLLDGTFYGYIGMNTQLGKKSGQLSFSAINLRSGNVEIRQNINDAPENIRTSQAAYYASYAGTLKALLPVDAGIAVKYVYYDMYTNSGGGAGADAGIAKSFSGIELFGKECELDAGAAALNVIRPKIQLIGSEYLDTVYKAGIRLSMPVAYRLSSRDVLSFIADMTLAENMLSQSCGAEMCFSDKFRARAGFFREHITTGAGIQAGSMTLDYAFDMGALANMHRFSISCSWPGKKAKRAKRKTGRDLLKEEARQALKENEQYARKLDKDAGPQFKAAVKDYRKKRFLTAADKFREIALKYPEYENSQLYYEKIGREMESASRGAVEHDFENVSYARGYVSYRNARYKDSLNEWQKALQINPGRSELEKYVSEVKAYLEDEEQTRRERAVEERICRLYEEGKNKYEAGKWVSCAKLMEEIQKICSREPIKASYEWNKKAGELLNNALSELSKQARAAKAEQEAGPPSQGEGETDPAGSGRKYTAGLVLYAQGKIEEAVRMWEMALRLDPNNEKAGKAVEKAREELGTVKRRK